MVDFTKFFIRKENVPPCILKNTRLNFTRPINVDTGELKKGISYKQADYKNMKFKLYDNGNLLISGSLHKYFNDGVHNYNKFPKSSLDDTLDDFSLKFNIQLEKCILQNIEIGLNIKPMVEPYKLIRDILIHSTEPFKYYSIKGSEYKQAIHQRYYIKAYDKRLMYNNKSFVDKNGKKQIHKIDEDIFRFEIKFVKMGMLNRIGINTLADLKDSTKLRLALEILCETWNDLTIYDSSIKTKNLTSYIKKTKLNQWQNVNYWIDLKKQRRLEQKRALEMVVKIHSDNIKQNTAERLSMEARELLFDFTKKKRKHNIVNSLPMNQDIEKANSLLFNTSYIELKGNILSRHFSITNLVNKNQTYVD